MNLNTEPFFVAITSLCYSNSANSCLFLLRSKGPKQDTRIDHTINN